MAVGFSNESRYQLGLACRTGTKRGNAAEVESCEKEKKVHVLVFHFAAHVQGVEFAKK